MKTTILAFLSTILLLTISCSNVNNGDNNGGQSKINLLVQDLPFELVDYYFIHNKDVIDDSNTTFLTFQDLNSFDNVFSHLDMMWQMDSATWAEYSRKLPSEEQFETNNIVAVILPESQKLNDIVITGVFLNDSILTVNYAYGKSKNLCGYSIAYFQKCNYNLIEGHLIE